MTEDAMTETAPGFFLPGHTYRHWAPQEGLFKVEFVGTAPEGFEYHSETLGVAYGWRRAVGPSGVEEPMGSYTTPDFAGWTDVTESIGPLDAILTGGQVRLDFGSLAKIGVSLNGVTLTHLTHLHLTRAGVDLVLAAVADPEEGAISLSEEHVHLVMEGAAATPRQKEAILAALTAYTQFGTTADEMGGDRG